VSPWFLSPMRWMRRTNIAKHARASRVIVSLSYLGNTVTLDITTTAWDYWADRAASRPGIRTDRDSRADHLGRRRVVDLERAGRGYDHRSFGAGMTQNKIRILIANDHPVVRDGLRGMLSGQPDLDVVAEAVNGEEAVVQAARHRPDVVLMDLRVPRTDGVQAISEIAARQPDVKVLVLTTYDADHDIARAIEAGAIGVLLKDAPREELFSAVRAVARGESVLAGPVATRLMNQLWTPPVDAPSERELEVLTLVARGLTNRAIGRRLAISEATVKTHLVHVFSKLGVTDRTAAVTVAVERGLIRLG
jgi:DNA-binding NarL/FixJ family response regulator